MEVIGLQVSLRKEKGKELNKKLRENGFVPAVVYKKGEGTLSLKVDGKNLYKTIHTTAGENVLIKLNIEGVEDRKERTVIVKEIQKDSIKDVLLHVDFQEISLTETLKVKVPITAKGEAVGVKQDGGVLQHVLWEIEVECLPINIPEKIEVDISNLKIGEAIYIKDMRIPETVKLLEDPEAVIFTVEHPKAVEDVVTTPAEGEIQEPEVIKAKKEEELPEDDEEKPKEEKILEEKK